MVIANYINDISDPKTRRAIQAVFDNLGSLIANDSLKQKSMDRDYTLEEFESCPTTCRKDTGGAPDYAMTKALAVELRADHATQKTSHDAMETLIEELHDDHATFKTAVDETKTLVDELHDDHATFKTEIDELHTWAETLATKMNSDAGITDADYDTTIAAATTATLTATKPTAGPGTLTATKPASGPGTLTATDPVGTAGDENLLIFDENIFEYHILGAQTIAAPVRSATGLNVGMDQTDNDGVEISQGILANSRSAFVVGTSKAFCLKVKFTIPDVSGTDDCAIGFRKAEAYQANIDDYDEMAALNVISGNITIETILNAGATTSTDTTDDWADAASKTLEVYVDANGVVTYKIDGVAPTTTAAFTFDDGEVVVPFFYFLHASDLAGAVTLVSWECGLQEAM